MYIYRILLGSALILALVVLSITILNQIYLKAKEARRKEKISDVADILNFSFATIRTLQQIQDEHIAKFLDEEEEYGGSENGLQHRSEEVSE